MPLEGEKGKASPEHAVRRQSIPQSPQDAGGIKADLREGSFKTRTLIGRVWKRSNALS